MTKPRIYFDDCEPVNGVTYFPYHRYDFSTWFSWISDSHSPTRYSPGYEDYCISAYARIYELIDMGINGWLSTNKSIAKGWVFNGTEVADTMGGGKLEFIDLGGTAVYEFPEPIPSERDYERIAHISFSYCDYGVGMGGNNNMYIYGTNGVIGIHFRRENQSAFPLPVQHWFAYMTLNGGIVDSWYFRNPWLYDPYPEDSYCDGNKIGNTWNYYIRDSNKNILSSLSCSVDIGDIIKVKFVAPSVSPVPGFTFISYAVLLIYDKSYGIGHFYKDLYTAGIDQKDLIFCNKINYYIKAPISIGSNGNNYLKFCLGYNVWDEWEYDIPIASDDYWTWEKMTIDITDIPYSVIEKGFKYVGFKYIHNQPETNYPDISISFDSIYSEPGDEKFWETDYAFVT